MKKKISNFKNFLKESVTALVNDEINRWVNEYNVSVEEINTGDCFVFAENLESLLASNGIDSEVLTTDLFYDLATEDAKEDEDVWYNEEDYNSHRPDNFKWITNGYHGWVYADGKHYDAEAPNGVINFYDLPIFKRCIKK